jgi:hypothetical protein
MPVLPSESRDAHDAAPQTRQLRESFDDEAAPHDDTTLKFTGRMAVTDEDAGGDPYNRTGRFRRVVR